MRAKLRDRIRDLVRDWAEQHGLLDEPAHLTDDEIAELAIKLDGLILDHYAQVLREPR